MKNLKTAKLHITMPDNSVWSVPVYLVAYHRAEYYASDPDYPFNGDVIRCLNEDIWPLFEIDPDYEIMDWAENNMDWKDVNATLVSPPPKPDYPRGWTGGDKTIVYE